MKKIYFLFTILLITTYSFGQTYSSSNPQFNWGGWNQTDCYKGIYIRVQKAYFNTLAKDWYYNIQIQNRYGRKAAISWRFFNREKGDQATTNSRKTFESNEIYSTGGFGSDSGVDWYLDKLCFEFQIVGGSVLDRCADIPNKDQFYYAQCDDGTPKYSAYTGNGQSNTQNGNQTSSQTNSANSGVNGNGLPGGNSVDAQISAQLQKKDDLCTQLSETTTRSSICTKTPADYMTGLTGTDSQINNRKYTILADIKADIYELESLVRQASAQQTAANAKQREDQDKQKRFDNFIAQGDNSLSSKNYDAALSYYSQAQNIAPNDGQKSVAKQKYDQAAEAKRTAARATRVADVQRKDNTEDATYVAAAGSAAAAMSMLKDGYTHKGFSTKFQVGVGYDQTPMITNQNNSNAALASYADKGSYPTVAVGLKFEILNNAPVNFNLRGIFTAGLHAFEPGVTGVHTVTGGEGGLQFWYKTDTKFKLFADFGFYERIGERKRDQDAVNNGASATDNVREGKYNYTVMRLGFGPMLHFRKDGKETWIKPGVYFDKLSFAKGDKPTKVFSLTTNIASALLIEATYSQNYPVAGTINYPTTFNAAKQNYFSIRIIRQGNLF